MHFILHIEPSCTLFGNVCREMFSEIISKFTEVAGMKVKIAKSGRHFPFNAPESFLMFKKRITGEKLEMPLLLPWKKKKDMKCIFTRVWCLMLHTGQFTRNFMMWYYKLRARSIKPYSGIGIHGI